MRLAAAMVMSETGGQDINRMARLFQVDLKLVDEFKLPQQLTASKVWEWRSEGYKIIREAAGYRMPATRDSLSGVVITTTFKIKLQKEGKIKQCWHSCELPDWYGAGVAIHRPQTLMVFSLFPSCIQS